MKDYSYLTNAHPSFIDSLYRQYIDDPNAVDSSWAAFFEGFEYNTNGTDLGRNGASSSASGQELEKEFNVMSIIHGYRDRGHLLSTTNPIRPRKDRKPYLNLSDYSLEEADLKRVFKAGEEIGLPGANLERILHKLQEVYTGNIGFEYAHIENKEKRMWLREKIETHGEAVDFGLSINDKKRILEKLNGSVIFEKFLHTKYLAQKRFSLEGGETTIPALDAMIETGAAKTVKEVVIGMAHRGRLNVLANIMGKTYEHIFNEFEGMAVPDLAFGDGDVKYHLGYSSQVQTQNGESVVLKLVPNPSHLESVNPVVEGFARAKADILYDSDYDKILPILIHGDAAVAGQGIIYETVQMSQLAGYYTGGTIHFVINNQIGFTTDYDDARSSTYSTGVASLVQAPVFHVNGDDPEAVIFAAKLAVEYRQRFNNDVFIDMVCYRRHGHNEGDDPSYTQPEMYNIIKNHPNPRELYIQKLIERGDVEKTLGEEMENNFWGDLQQRLDLVKQKPLPYTYQEPEQAWRRLKRITDASDYENSPSTGISKETFQEINAHLLKTPENFNVLRGVQRLLKGKNKWYAQDKMDWAMAELLAYGSILLDGKNVRMSGQDVKRGTFSHRHAVFMDAQNNQEYNRLNGIRSEQGEFMIYNSLLSEFGVLGFEYGYSLASPDSLVIWEAQFGDFYNGAQVIVDQYISAAESKWQRMSGLVMLLPHGYEGQGPEHSSARLERFLQLCSENNMTIANLTTPANLFHILRRQLERPFRKPLIIMSPKSLLRHPLCISDFSEFTGDSKFEEVYDDHDLEGKVKKVLFCSGKIYYDLLKKKQADKRNDIAVIRIEQLYPLPTAKIDNIIQRHKDAGLLLGARRTH